MNYYHSLDRSSVLLQGESGRIRARERGREEEEEEEEESKRKRGRIFIAPRYDPIPPVFWRLQQAAVPIHGEAGQLLAKRAGKGLILQLRGRGQAEGPGENSAH